MLDLKCGSSERVKSMAEKVTVSASKISPGGASRYRIDSQSSRRSARSIAKARPSQTIA